MAASRPRTMSTQPGKANEPSQPSKPIETSQPNQAATFADLGVPASVVRALAGVGVTTPFPIQAATLPDSLAGRDVLGRGRTGSGKTYAFLLPLLTRLAGSGAPRRSRAPRGLVLAPTRELASQIEASLAPLARALSLRSVTIFGGVPAGGQIRALREGVDIVIACPGRLEDLTGSGHADLGAVEVTVLDEADHMADLGFLPVVRRLLDRVPADGQRLLFSATLDSGVDVLVRRYLTDPVVHSVDSAQSPVRTMDHHVLHVDAASRLSVITDLAAAPGRTLVFTRTKFGAKALSRKLNASGVRAVELHGNLSQNARSRNLSSFMSGEATTLVATDIAARGIHVDDVALVIHADPPVEHKAYLHRSGRTARAGARGTVVTMMLDAQVRDVRDLTRKAGVQPVTTRVGQGHPLLASIAPGERRFTAPVVPAAGAGGRGGSDGLGGSGGSRGAGGSRSAGRAQGRNRSGGERSGSGSARAGSGGGRRQPGGSRAAGAAQGRPATSSGHSAQSGHSAAAFSQSARR